MTTPANPLRDLTLLIKARQGLIFLDTADEGRVKTLLRHLADQLTLPYFEWSATKGLRKSNQKDSVYNTTKLLSALDHIEASRFPGVYYFVGLEPYLEDKVVVQRLKDGSACLKEVRGAFIASGADMEIPPSLLHHSVLFRFPQPSLTEYRDLLLNLLRDMKSRMPVSVRMTQAEAGRLLHGLKGLTLLEAEKILTKVIIEDGVLDASDIRKVLHSKKDIVAQDGLLEYYPVEQSLDDIADLKGLKTWLWKRKQIIQHPEKARAFGLRFPKGLLLLGVQGCGKSLCAKAVSMEWDLPLLKFDPSNLYNKYIGDSEKNFKKATKAAEKMAPVILWIDEIEKAFSSSDGGEDGGVSTRILGSFLSWMQERKGDVFIMATANNIHKLPPEFLRKGRFDEIFFVDLPNEEAREAIFQIHLKKRKRDPRQFDLAALGKASAGFSGAEIEEAIVSALYSAFSSNAHLSTELILHEINATRPISVTMGEKIEELRAWAKERTVSAQ